MITGIRRYAYLKERSTIKKKLKNLSNKEFNMQVFLDTQDLKEDLKWINNQISLLFNK
jgi:hypothetical protein